MSWNGRRVAAFVLAVALPSFAVPASAQHPVEGIDLMIQNLRPAGQPVIPIFEGWFPRADGSFALCFGYFSLNLEETVEIPLGPDNFIEPTRFDGAQPTHFAPVPPPPNDHRRRFCSFTVDVPADFPADERVVWTLRLDGRDYSVPGHRLSHSYQLEEGFQRSREVHAPVVKLEPDGPETVGRRPVTAGPLAATVGTALELTLSVVHPQAERFAVNPWHVHWEKHRGPGAVRFSPEDQPGGWLVVDSEQGERTATAFATFAAPGRYLLRVEAIDNPTENGSYQFQCCWTHLYVEVEVTERSESGGSG